MSTAAVAPQTTSDTTTEEPKGPALLTRLVDHAEKMVAADLPSDVRKVLGALIHWIDAGGQFVQPDVFNPAASEAVAQAEANEARLAQENADLNKRLAALETLVRGQVAAAPPAAPVTTSPGPVASDPSVGAAAPAAPVTPGPTIPGVIQAPPEAADQADTTGDATRVAELEAQLAAAQGSAPQTPPASV